VLVLISFVTQRFTEVSQRTTEISQYKILKFIMEKKIIECVPNFSEGRDMGIIKQITEVIESVKVSNCLMWTPGEDTNRTVVTFVGFA